MLISILFVFTLSCTFSLHTSAGVLNAENNGTDSDGADTSTANCDKTMVVPVISTASGSEDVLLFDSKLEAFTAALNRIDVSVQDLHEKSHSWAILRHHIDAWNDQLKVHEQKMELLRRSQDEQVNKLTNLELMLGKVLSKLSEDCPFHPVLSATDANVKAAPLPAPQPPQSNSQLLQAQVEMSSRLNNILRHLQNIEKKQNELRVLTEAGTAAVTPSVPSTPTVTSAKASGGSQSVAAMNLPIKEIKQLHSLAKKNAKLLEHILQEVSGADERCDGVAHSLNQRIDSISGELATFTGSSDLLLKRIESLLRVAVYKESDMPLKTKSGADDDTEIEEQEGPVEEESELDNEVSTVDVKTDLEANEVDEQQSEMSIRLPTLFKPEILHCHQLNREESENGIYVFSAPQLNEANRDYNTRLCIFGNPLLDNDGSAWTVIQNRGPYNVQESFNRSWSEYRNGFGSLERDFWYGNEFVHQLLAEDDYVLRVELTDDQGSYGWGEYSLFRLDSEEYNYNLMIGGFSSNGLPDALQFNNDQDFSTYDRRNDKSVDACCPCAVTYGSGWWFDRCSEVNLNGVYRHKATGNNYVGIIWQDWPFEDYSLRTSRIMMRPRNNYEEQRAEDP